MKKIVLTLLAGVSMQLAVAQKMELTNAILTFNNGKLDQAKTSIDKASTNDKTIAMSKTWFYKGEIYRSLMESPIYKSKAPADAPQIAFEAYDKYLQMDPKGEFAKKAMDGKTGLYGTIFNQGVGFYNEKNYDKALESYAVAAKMKPEDTTAYVYSVYAAEAKEDYPRAKQMYRQLISMNHKPLAHYKRIIDITQQVEKNPTET